MYIEFVYVYMNMLSPRTKSTLKRNESRSIS